MYFGRETHCERLTDSYLSSPNLKVFMISAPFFLIMSFPVQASLTPCSSQSWTSPFLIALLFFATDFARRVIYSCLSGHTLQDCSPSLSDTREFTAVSPSREGVVISLGHSNYAVKEAAAKAHPCFQTRRQPL